MEATSPTCWLRLSHEEADGYPHLRMDLAHSLGGRVVCLYRMGGVSSEKILFSTRLFSTDVGKFQQISVIVDKNIWIGSSTKHERLMNFDQN